MNKEDIIAGIKSLAAAGQINRSEVIAAYEEGSGVSPAEHESSTTLSRYSGILYYIGGGIVFLGLVFFISELWSSFNTFMRIFITLGTGIGSALFVDGRLVPNLEFGHHPFEKDRTYEERLGDAELAFSRAFGSGVSRLPVLTISSM